MKSEHGDDEQRHHNAYRSRPPMNLQESVLNWLGSVSDHDVLNMQSRNTSQQNGRHSRGSMNRQHQSRDRSASPSRRGSNDSLYAEPVATAAPLSRVPSTCAPVPVPAMNMNTYEHCKSPFMLPLFALRTNSTFQMCDLIKTTAPGLCQSTSIHQSPATSGTWLAHARRKIMSVNTHMSIPASTPLHHQALTAVSYPYRNMCVPGAHVGSQSSYAQVCRDRTTSATLRPELSPRTDLKLSRTDPQLPRLLRSTSSR